MFNNVNPMNKTALTKPRAKKRRITRSINFEGSLLDYVKRKAKELRRSPNWVVNEMVRKELASEK